MPFNANFLEFFLILLFLFRFSKGSSSKDFRPNIILFISDDQDIELGSMEYMQKTLRIFRDEGAEFVNGMVTTPICCPSRSSILTGVHVHNHNVNSNNDNCTGTHWQTHFEPKTFATYLKNSGYRTGYFGKYLNEYNGSYIPPGWTEWMGLVKNSRFYNYTVNFNGEKIKHGFDYERDYFTDLIVNDSLAFFKREMGQLENSLSEEYEDFPLDFSQPVLMVLSFPAPHGPEDPAPHYSNLFFNSTTHRTPSWNYAPNPDKQWILQHTGKMEPVHVAFTDFLQRRRLQTLQSIDDAVQRVYDELKNLGQLDNTFMLYTSDHGYHLGQFGLIKGKSMPYDFDLRVPYFLRGPNVAPGLKIEKLVLNIDIAPTLLDMARISVPLKNMDGRSILQLVKSHWEKRSDWNFGNPPWRHTALIERGLRPKLVKLRERLLRQNELFSKEVRVQKECKRKVYQTPCKIGQHWECRQDDVGKWRIFKCRSEPSWLNMEHSQHCDCTENLREKRTVVELRNKRKSWDNLANATENMTGEQPLDVDHFNVEKNGEFFNSSSYYNNITADDIFAQWENEFLDYVSQKEIVNSDWFQGRFDAVDNFEANVEGLDKNEEGADDSEEGTDEKSLLRVKRSKLHHMREHFRRRKKKNRKKCDTAFSKNSSGYLRCIRRRYTNLNEWRVDVEKLNAEIRTLRDKLHNKLDLRRLLKEDKPPKNRINEPISVRKNFADFFHVNRLSENSITRKCDCERKPHPLKKISAIEYISYADLVAIAEERRKLRSSTNNQNQTAQNYNKKQKRKNDKSKTLNGGKSAKKKFCNVPNLNCFTHDNNHWKTPPFWTLGPFCFCQNSNNNTYWCLRTINDTHNFLYCEFVTGFVSFYDMTVDRHQLHNIVYTLSYSVLEQLSAQLDKLRRCRGAKECSRYERVKFERRPNSSRFRNILAGF